MGAYLQDIIYEVVGSVADCIPTCNDALSTEEALVNKDKLSRAILKGKESPKDMFII